MRSVFFAAKVFFGKASAAAPAPATWISLRREMVIDVRSFSLGEANQSERAAGADQSTRAPRWQQPRPAGRVRGGFACRPVVYLLTGCAAVLPCAHGPRI